MNYLLKSKPKNENRWKIFLAVFVFVVLILFGTVFPTASRSIFYNISKPFWASENFIAKPFHGIFNFFSFKKTLIKNNADLSEEVSNLRLKQVDYDILLKENQELKDLIGRASQKNLVFAKVLSRPPRSPYDTFVIDIGSNQGIVPANRVYVSDNIIIGLVTSVTPNTSLVRLFSTGENKQEAVLSRTGASFILTGKGGANFQIEVPKDTDILWGDAFLYPGINSSVLGNVYYIDSNSQSSFKTIYIRTPGNVFQAKSVFVDTSVK